MKRWFGKQTRPAVQPAASADPFAAIPSMAKGVEAREDARGNLQIRKSAPRKTGPAARLAQRLGFRRHVRVNLDTNGTLFWKQIDGRRSLRDIEHVIRQQTGLAREETEKAVILFAKMLLLRHLIYLAVPQGQRRGKCESGATPCPRM